MRFLHSSPKIERKWLWVWVWVFTTLAVGLAFFWLRLIEYKGSLWLVMTLPVFHFAGLGALLGLGNDGILVVYAIAYGALASVWFLPSGLRWRSKILWLAWVYLGLVAVTCFLFFGGGIVRGGI